MTGSLVFIDAACDAIRDVGPVMVDFFLVVYFMAACHDSRDRSLSGLRACEADGEPVVWLRSSSGRGKLHLRAQHSHQGNRNVRPLKLDYLQC